MDSVFNLQRPYDLMALLKQEERADMLESLKHELLSQRGDIDDNEDKDTGEQVSLINYTCYPLYGAVCMIFSEYCI